MIVRITYSREYNHINIEEVYLPDLTDGVIKDLNDCGFCLRFFSQNYNNYYINTETVKPKGFSNDNKKMIEKAMEFKLKKRSNTIKQILNGDRV